MKTGINTLWPTNVLYGKIEDQAELATLVAELLSLFDIRNPPGDFGDASIFDTESEVLDNFKNNIVLPAFNNYLQEVYNLKLDDFGYHKVKSWITGGSPNYNLANHNHSGSQLTAVFYLMAESTDKGGKLVLVDPRSNANRGYPPKLRSIYNNIEFQPTTGDYLIFPSFLYHYVNTYYAPSLRLCVPVDLFLAERD